MIHRYRLHTYQVLCKDINLILCIVLIFYLNHSRHIHHHNLLCLCIIEYIVRIDLCQLIVFYFLPSMITLCLLMKMSNMNHIHLDLLLMLLRSFISNLTEKGFLNEFVFFMISFCFKKVRFFNLIILNRYKNTFNLLVSPICEFVHSRSKIFDIFQFCDVFFVNKLSFLILLALICFIEFNNILCKSWILFIIYFNKMIS